MGTRSCVAVRTPEGYFRTIYVHWDGYVNGVGAGLLVHAPTYETAMRLIDNGDHSTIMALDDPVSYRDRGEAPENTAPQLAKTPEELRTVATENYGAAYLYILDVFGGDKKWHVYTGDFTTEWIDQGTIEMNLRQPA